MQSALVCFISDKDKDKGKKDKGKDKKKKKKGEDDDELPAIVSLGNCHDLRTHTDACTHAYVLSHMRLTRGHGLH